MDNKKFDLRIYVLITQLGSYPDKKTIAFVAEEGMVRLCTEDYNQPDKGNLHNLLQHLTNYSLNKLSDKYVKIDNLDTVNEDKASKRPLSSMLEYLKAEKGIDSDSILQKISKVCQKTLIAC